MISVFVSVQMQVLAVVCFISPLSVKLKEVKNNPRYCSTSSQGFSLKNGWGGKRPFLREKPWGRGCMLTVSDDFVG